LENILNGGRKWLLIHWDNFTQPISASLQPILVTRGRGWEDGLVPPAQPGGFHGVFKIQPGLMVKQLDIFKEEL
jgi:hypothetical protein